jgi:mannose-6-phosphate isomerase-like protein (cupin superfamily)
MEAYGLDQLITFSRESHTKHVFFESEKLKAQVMGLEAGQQIPPCRMEHDVVFVVLEGRGLIVVDREEQAVGKSAFVFVPRERETRSIKAVTKMSLLAVQIRS